MKTINLKNVGTNEVIKVKAVKDGQGKVSYENLPPEVEVNVYHYTHEERWQNFADVIMCLLTMHATLNADQIGVIGPSSESESKSDLPSTEEYQ